MEMRLAARSLLRTPGTSALIVLLFAAAVGLTTAVFSFFQAAILRPLPYADPDRLVFVSESHPDRGKNSALRPGNFHDLKEESEVFSTATSSRVFEARFEEDGAAELVPVAMVLEDFFETLGVSPLLGRAFDASDHEIIHESYMGPGHGLGRVTILSYGFWKRIFGGDARSWGARSSSMAPLSPSSESCRRLFPVWEETRPSTCPGPWMKGNGAIARSTFSTESDAFGTE
jgi:hypothetical protein